MSKNKRKKQTSTKSAIHTQMAVFPGSFDPLTNGHVDIVERTLTIFDRVVVGVLGNSLKKELFTADERVELIRQQFKPYGDRVVVQSFSGLLVDFLKKTKCRVVVRGLRAISDYDYEGQMALMNRNLSRGSVETLFMVAREANSYISSTVVKQVAVLGGSVAGMVPPVVERALTKKCRQRKR